MAGWRHVAATEAYWRPSNQMQVLNTNMSEQLGVGDALGMRMWRLAPGQASTKHRHVDQVEVYVVLEGVGRIRMGDDVLTLGTGDWLSVEAETVRQIFNDTDADALWLVVGAPPELANTLEMSDELKARLYPDGMKALPPELT